MGKKVWIFNHYSTNQYIQQGGRHYWFAKNLIKKGYEPVIFCANVCHFTNVLIDVEGKNQTVRTLDGIPFVFVNTKIYEGNGVKRIRNMTDFYFHLFKAAKHAANIFGYPDVIFASSVHPLTVLAGIKLAKKWKVPCISEIRDLWPESIVAYGMLKRENILSRMMYRGEKWLYKHSDAIIMTWQGGKQYILDKKWQEDIDISNVHHISNGVDMEEFDENSHQFTIKDADLHDSAMKKVIYTGSVRYVNNISLLIDAAKILQKKKKHNIRILIFGDGNERQVLEERVQNEQVSNIIFKEAVEKKYVPYILKQGTINILHNSSTSLNKYGQSQNKFFEYLAAGRAIVQTYSTGFSMIDQYKCGISAKKQTAQEIANCIINACESNELKQMGENARKAAHYHDFSHLTDKLIEVIESVRVE